MAMGLSHAFETRYSSKVIHQAVQFIEDESERISIMARSH